MGGIAFDGNKEAEGGEAFGVLSKSATGKHFDLFNQVVNSLNNDNLDFLNNGNNLNVFSDNYNLEQGQNKTNSLLSKIANKTEPYFNADGKVIGTKKGNKIEIINK
jgi:hypothetical protein